MLKSFEAIVKSKNLNVKACRCVSEFLFSVPVKGNLLNDVLRAFTVLLTMRSTFFIKWWEQIELRNRRVLIKS